MGSGVGVGGVGVGVGVGTGPGLGISPTNHLRTSPKLFPNWLNCLLLKSFNEFYTASFTYGKLFRMFMAMSPGFENFLANAFNPSMSSYMSGQLETAIGS